MRILSIGNSFSQDAQSFLHSLAAGEGREAECFNLCIGGCSLERHWENVSRDLPAYALEHNGALIRETGASVRETLNSGAWDVITLQQVSYLSGEYDTYQPYLDRLAGFLRAGAPGAKIMLQQTWAYETDSDHGEFHRYGRSQARMYEKLLEAYDRASAAADAELIPVGEVIQALRALPQFDYPRGERSLCRDGFHLDMVFGRYAAAATWYLSLFRAPVRGGFTPEGLGGEERALLSVIRETAERIVGI